MKQQITAMALAAMALVSTSSSSANLSGTKRGEPRAPRLETKLLEQAASASNADEPSLTTDRDSYSPGETITFTGKNWAASEEYRTGRQMLAAFHNPALAAMS